MAVTPRLLHESVARGNMGFQFFLWAIPAVSLALVASAAIGRRLADRPRRALMAASILLACGAFTLLRSKGLTGSGMPEFTWRWTPSAEERLLSEAPPLPPAAPAPVVPAVTRPAATPAPAEPVPVTGDRPVEPAPAAAAPVAAATAPRPPVEWPGFRGPHRDGVLPGVRVGTDWSASPPALLWRRPIGPGVSSFAVRGNGVYTHEQRGEEEIVAAYDLRSGEPVWTHRDAARFWDAHVGAGPRATPTLDGGRALYAGGDRHPQRARPRRRHPALVSGCRRRTREGSARCGASSPRHS